MKKLILILLSFFLIKNAYNQQITYYSQDYLQNLFKRGNLFSLANGIDPARIKYKDCYFDTIVKPYFIKMLDPKAYAEQRYKWQVEGLSRDTLNVNMLIQYNLKHKFKKSYIDSVFKDSILYQKFKDSIIQLYTKQDSEAIINAKEICYEAIQFNQQIKYPESYTLIKQNWILWNKNNYYDFHALLYFEDYEVEEIYTKKIDAFIEKGLFDDSLLVIESFLFQLNNSYSVKQLTRLLIFDKNIDYFGDGNTISFRCEILKFLKDLIYENSNIKIDGVNKWDSRCDIIVNYKDEIIKDVLSKEVTDSLDSKNSYWKDNIKYFWSDDVKKQ